MKSSRRLSWRGSVRALSVLLAGAGFAAAPEAAQFEAAPSFQAGQAPAAAAGRTALKPLATAKDLAPGRTLGDTQLAALGWTLQLKAGNKLGE